MSSMKGEDFLEDIGLSTGARMHGAGWLWMAVDWAAPCMHCLCMLCLKPRLSAWHGRSMHAVHIVFMHALEECSLVISYDSSLQSSKAQHQQ
jgi:hypothetical protein